MIPLAMIVLDELRDGVSEVPLTDWNDAVETFFLDRPYKSLGVGVRVWRALGDPHDADTRVPQPTADILIPFPISIADKICCRLTTRGSAMVSVRAICCMNSASGCGVDPRICTPRDARSMMKTVYYVTRP
jgi:hypothetical protein